MEKIGLGFWLSKENVSILGGSSFCFKMFWFYILNLKMSSFGGKKHAELYGSVCLTKAGCNHEVYQF